MLCPFSPCLLQRSSPRNQPSGTMAPQDILISLPVKVPSGNHLHRRALSFPDQGCVLCRQCLCRHLRQTHLASQTMVCSVRSHRSASLNSYPAEDVQNFFAKAAQIITQSRIDDPPTYLPGTTVKYTNKWVCLLL
jgi:hypothetical protein